MKEKSYNEISTALRALAESDATQEAAPHVEAALLQAFRQTVAPETKTAAAPQPARVLAFPALFARQPRAWSFALAAAAFVLMCFGWFGWRVWQRPVPSKDYVATDNHAQVTPTPAPIVETSTPRVNETPTHVKPQPSQFIAASHKSAPKRPRLQPAEIAAIEEEIATEYFPLVSQDVLPARGRVRRVQVPRSTLVNFGLPVNAERLEIPIQADLIVGEDGAARAIRFVQERYPANPVINVYGGSRKLIPTSFRNPR